MEIGNGLTLLVGGARSGKSDLAVRLGRSFTGPVTFAATAIAFDHDETAASKVSHRTIYGHHSHRIGRMTVLNLGTHQRVPRTLSCFPVATGLRLAGRFRWPLVVTEYDVRSTAIKSPPLS